MRPKSRERATGSRLPETPTCLERASRLAAEAVVRVNRPYPLQHRKRRRAGCRPRLAPPRPHFRRRRYLQPVTRRQNQRHVITANRPLRAHRKPHNSGRTVTARVTPPAGH